MEEVSVKEMKKIIAMLWDIHQFRSEFTNLLFKDEKDFIKNAPHPFGWAELYSDPFPHLYHGMIDTLDHKGEIFDQLQQAKTLQDIESALSVLDEENSKPKFKDYGEGEEHTKYMFLCFWFALLRSLESIQVYGRSLNRLIEDVATGDDKALFHAVNLDHTVTQNTHVSRRIAIAELKGDKNFFKQLANKTKTRPKKSSPEKYPLRYLLALTHEIGLLDKLSMEEAYELFCVELKVYDDKGADPAGSLWRFIQRWKDDNLKPYYST